MSNILKKQIERLIKGAPTERTVTVRSNTITDREVQAVSIRKTPIMWGIPCDELGYSQFWITFERHSNRMPWDGFCGTMNTYLPGARNTVHNAFLDSDLPFLMMLDSDILFPPNIADRLVIHNMPIVGGWYRNKIGDNHPIVYDFLNDDEHGVAHWRHKGIIGNGLQKVDGMGAGCWLIRRDAAEAVGRDPYDMLTGGEDLVFSRKIMKLGIPMYVDWSVNCAHLGIKYV